MKKLTQHWLSLAEKDFLAANYLFNGARYPHAIYFLCQAIEKILKAELTKTTDKKPPYIHNLYTLGAKTTFDFSSKQLSFLQEFNKHYSRVRYPDLAQVSYNTRKKTTLIFITGKNLYLWIKNQSNKH